MQNTTTKELDPDDVELLAVCEPSLNHIALRKPPLLIDTPDFDVSEFLTVRLYQSVKFQVRAFMALLSVPTAPCAVGLYSFTLCEHTPCRLSRGSRV